MYIYIYILTLSFWEATKKRNPSYGVCFCWDHVEFPLKNDINSSLGSPNVMRPNAVPTTKNLKLLHVAWEKIRMYLYIRRLYAYNKSIGSIAKQFQDSCLWIYVCQFSVYKHNMINYVDYVLLGNAWTSLKKYRKSEICKTLDTFQPHALLSQMYLDHKALPQKNTVVAFFSSWTFYWTFELWSGSIPPFHVWKLDEHWSNLDKVS